MQPNRAHSLRKDNKLYVQKADEKYNDHSAIIRSATGLNCLGPNT